MGTTLISKAQWVVAWDVDAHRHIYLRDTDVAFDERGISHVGSDYSGTASQVVDGRKRMVLPGLVNVHAHPGVESAYRGLREEHGVRNQYMSGLFERYQAFEADDELRAASSELAYCELIRSGVTSVVDIGPPWPGWTDLITRSGLRGFLAPSFASARWRMRNDHELLYEWDEDSGVRRFDAALRLIDSLATHPSGRLSGVVSPAQIDTCSPELLRSAFDAARARRLPYTVHIAQGASEVFEMIRRHGKTPVAWAAELGILGPATILGHAIFLDSHSWIRWWTKRDLGLIAEHGCSVAHCPTPFARYGHLLEDFGAYQRAGVNMALGTDVAPHNLIEELRKASSLARIAARDIHAVTLADLLNAATVGGAHALGRTDLGRIAIGMKADLVLVDLDRPGMRPARDPLRSFVYHAADRAIDEVYVDGRRVFAAGNVLTLNESAAAQRLEEHQARMIDRVPLRDYRGRTADQIAPLSLYLGRQ